MSLDQCAVEFVSCPACFCKQTSQAKGSESCLAPGLRTHQTVWSSAQADIPSIYVTASRVSAWLRAPALGLHRFFA